MEARFGSPPLEGRAATAFRFSDAVFFLPPQITAVKPDFTAAMIAPTLTSKYVRLAGGGHHRDVERHEDRKDSDGPYGAACAPSSQPRENNSVVKKATFRLRDVSSIPGKTLGFAVESAHAGSPRVRHLLGCVGGTRCSHSGIAECRFPGGAQIGGGAAAIRDRSHPHSFSGYAS